MDSTRFDALTRALATTTSRRGVLRGAVTALIGGLALHWQGNGVDAASCGSFCNELPPGRQRGECARACARDRSLIETCEGDPTRLCVEPTGPTCCSATGACFDPFGPDAPERVCVECPADGTAFACISTPSAICVACGGWVEVINPIPSLTGCICHID